MNKKIPMDIKRLHSKGLQLQKDGRQEKAIEYFNKALVIDANNSDILYDKAVSLQILLRFEEAVTYYDKVIEVESNNFAVFINKRALSFKSNCQ